MLICCDGNVSVWVAQAWHTGMRDWIQGQSGSAELFPHIQTQRGYGSVDDLGVEVHGNYTLRKSLGFTLLIPSDWITCRHFTN